MNAVPTAPLWHTRSLLKVTVDVTKLVATDLEMQPMSQTNMIRSRSKRVRDEAEQKNAMKLSEESHEFILDEIRMRERGLNMTPAGCLWKQKMIQKVMKMRKKNEFSF